MTPSASALPEHSPLDPPALRTSASGARPVRVLVVDDSVVMRRLITRMLSSEPGIEVVGSARDGADALARVAQLQPDLVTLDVEMPEMNGLEALRLIQASHPRVRVIMCSSLTARGAAVTIDALLNGASDYVTKQASASLGESGYEQLRKDLLSRIKQLFDPALPSPRPQSPPSKRTASPTPAPHVHKAAAPQILAIGVSTGGPAALAEIIPLLPADFPLPVAVVQHMPPFFTQLLAERLARLSRVAVHEATYGLELRPGVVVVAPGDFHMRVVRRSSQVQVELDQRQQENSCRPAVDVLFRSVAEVYGGAALAVILTGMGQDGLLGAGALKSRGASVLVQDAASSVVWGMPGAVANAHLADAVLPLHEIIPEVLRRL